MNRMITPDVNEQCQSAYKMSTIILRSLVLWLTCVFLTETWAAEFRHFDAIKHRAGAQIGDGYQASENRYQLDRRLIEHAINTIAKSYGKPELRDLLDTRFGNRDQLVDSTLNNLPLDATLRVLSIQAPKVLRQSVKLGANGNLKILSDVSATVRAQLEFSDPEAGYQRIEDTSEWLIKLTTERLVMENQEASDE